MRRALLVLALAAVFCSADAWVCEQGKWLYQYKIKKWQCHDYKHSHIQDVVKGDFAEKAYHKAMWTLYEWYEANHQQMVGECEPVKAWPLQACYKSIIPGKAGKQFKGIYGFVVKVELECPYKPFKIYQKFNIKAHTRRDFSYWAPLEVEHIK